MFGTLPHEIDALKLCGVQIHGVHYDVHVLVVADFKLLYSVSGSWGANCMHPCLYCKSSHRMMDCTAEQLFDHFEIENLADLPRREEVCDLTDKPSIEKWQKGSTFNLLRIRRARPTNIVPPPLHIFLGIVNKIVETLDLVVACLEAKVY